MMPRTSTLGLLVGVVIGLSAPGTAIAGSPSIKCAVSGTSTEIGGTAATIGKRMEQALLDAGDAHASAPEQSLYAWMDLRASLKGAAGSTCHEDLRFLDWSAKNRQDQQAPHTEILHTQAHAQALRRIAFDAWETEQPDLFGAALSGLEALVDGMPDRDPDSPEYPMKLGLTSDLVRLLLQTSRIETARARLEGMRAHILAMADDPDFDFSTAQLAVDALTEDLPGAEEPRGAAETTHGAANPSVRFSLDRAMETALTTARLTQGAAKPRNMISDEALMQWSALRSVWISIWGDSTAHDLEFLQWSRNNPDPGYQHATVLIDILTDDAARPGTQAPPSPDLRGATGARLVAVIAAMPDLGPDEDVPDKLMVLDQTVERLIQADRLAEARPWFDRLRAYVDRMAKSPGFDRELAAGRMADLGAALSE
jgi:hypothetical protein